MGVAHELIDDRNIEVSHVGIMEYFVPVIFLNGNDRYETMVKFDCGVSLSAEKKGARLSRIIESIDSNLAFQEIQLRDLGDVVKTTAKLLECNNLDFKMEFDIAFSLVTPVSNRKTYLNSTINIQYKLNGNILVRKISMTSNGAMLCPNSKLISEYGAHSQRCEMKFTLEGEIEEINIKKLIMKSMEAFSCEVYGVVKSVDEKVMTEKAYDNPKFTEDLIRDALLKLREEFHEGRIIVEVKNIETIHQHSVRAIGEIQ
ncbi:GTP cyclohydrolase, FolE2/MptA family [Fusibacter sp. JL216-2]|uniref:GTP cyclohydrolase, FolE2/MptA family n=1 Tax=Fusibacter sp. JL216-2 TaxID=3071453 RepID=UPI003D33D1C3